jgi:hypothetical protein
MTMITNMIRSAIYCRRRRFRRTCSALEYSLKLSANDMFYEHAPTMLSDIDTSGSMSHAKPY